VGNHKTELSGQSAATHFEGHAFTCEWSSRSATPDAVEAAIDLDEPLGCVMYIFGKEVTIVYSHCSLPFPPSGAAQEIRLTKSLYPLII
jgi:hypothetical protein